MRLSRSHFASGFTLPEMMMSVTIGSAILAALIASSVALQKSFAAVDNYFQTHSQQMRVVDFFGRDVKRSYITSAATDPATKLVSTVNCVIPNYVVQSGDADANATNIGTRRTPTLSFLQNTYYVSYGGSRIVTDAVTINASAALTSPTAAFTVADVGKKLAGNGIPLGTTISAFVNATTVTMSNNSTATATAVTATIGNLSNVTYSVSGNSIIRTENGAVTTIASSTDQLLPSNTDVQLASTEYMATAITFAPTFTFGNGGPNANANAQALANAAAKRAGTTVYSTAYLRNARRGN